MLPTVIFPGLGNISLEMNPVAFTLFGRGVAWYGIIIAVGFLLAAIYVLRRAPSFGLNEDIIIDAMLWATPIGVICARAYYVIFNFDLYRDDPVSILYIWKGGLAIYGGVIGALVTIAVFCKVRHVKFGALADAGAMGLMIGQIIGRWGNFINCEAHGGETTLPWRMVITYSPDSADLTVGYHPTFLYESLWNLLGFVLIHFYSKKHRKFRGEICLMYITWYGLGRGFIEGLRTDSLYFFDTNMRVSQFVGFASFIVGLALLIYNWMFKVHDPEEVTCLAYTPKAVAAAGSSDADEQADAASEAEAGADAETDADTGSAAGTDAEADAGADVDAEAEPADDAAENKREAQ